MTEAIAYPRVATRAREQQVPVQQLVVSWILMLCLFFFTTRGFFSFLDESAASRMVNAAASAGPGRQISLLANVILLTVTYSTVSWLVALRIKGVLAVAAYMKALSFLALLTILSAVWSQDSLRSAYNGIFYLLCTLFAYYLVSRFSVKDIMRLFMMTGMLACILGMILVVFFPQYGLSYAELRTAGAWRGVFFDRTSAGKVLIFLLSPALVFGYKTFNYRRLAYIALLLTSIVMARAVTALIVVSAYVAFMFMLNYAKRFERRTALLLVLIGAQVSVISAFLIMPLVGAVLNALGRDLSLTGRTDIWTFIMPSVWQRPVLGYGFYSFWLGMGGESGRVIRAAHWFFGYAHNGMLEIVLQLGFAGLLLFLFTFFKAVRDAVTCYRERSIGVDWCIGIIFLTLLYNIDESTVLWPSDLLSILYVVACSVLALAAHRVRSDARRARFQYKSGQLKYSNDLSLA